MNLFRRPEWAFFIVSAVGVFGGTFYFWELHELNRAALFRRYEVESARRYAAIEYRLTQKRQALKTLTAFFQASGEVERHEFDQFAASLIKMTGLSQACWIPSGSESRYSVPARPKIDRCGEFNFALPNRIFTNQTPHIMMSEFAQSRGGQKGFVVVVSNFEFLKPRFSDVGLTRESLIYSDSLQNFLLNYRIDSSEFEYNTASVSSDTVHYRYFPLGDFHESSFLYLAELSKENSQPDDRPVVFFSFLIFAFFAVVGLYLSNALRQKEKISQRVALKTDELQQSNAELEQFAYRTSHDLKSPLASIKGLTAIMSHQLQHGDTDEVALNIKKIHVLSTRLLNLVRDLFLLTRSSHIEDKVQVFDFPQEIEALFNSLKDRPSFPRITLTQAVELSKPFHTQAVRMRQILDNLVSNGVKYHNPMIENSFVRVTVREASQTLHISVNDNGLGIPESHANAVFGMFQRFHPDIEGSGLGLYLTKKHVEALGGQIDFQSSPSGTCFSVSIPWRH